MSDEIRITDLSRPQLDDTQRAAMAWAENLTIELSVDSVLGQARQTTGLLDFGPEDFIERLGLLCDEWSSDHELTALGRLTLRNKLVQHAGSRLLIQDSWTRHPEILDIAIERPIIVVGLPRSGTTHLLNTLAADPRLRSLPLWESYEPLPLPGEPSTGDENDPRWFRCQKAWEGMQSVTPHLAAMHPMNPDHVHEELELMGPDFASYNYEWLAHSPRWRDHYLGHDQQPHYDYMKNVLRLLTWRDQQASLANSNRASGRCRAASTPARTLSTFLSLKPSSASRSSRWSVKRSGRSVTSSTSTRRAAPLVPRPSTSMAFRDTKCSTARRSWAGHPPSR